MKKKRKKGRSKARERERERRKKRTPEKSPIEARSNNQRKSTGVVCSKLFPLQTREKNNMGTKNATHQRKNRKQDWKKNICESYRNNETTHRKRKKLDEKKRS